MPGPGTPARPAPHPESPVHYPLAFRYVLDRPGGFTNLLLVTVCEFIPVVGPVVALGYRAEVAEALDRDPDMRRHPKFDFNRFVEYLTRGVWPFLVALLLTIPVIPVVIGGFVAGLVLDPPGPNNPPVLALVFGGTGVVAGAVLYTALASPMAFHAELTGTFDFGGAFRFAVDFWRVMAVPVVVTWVVFAFLAFGVTVLGLLCCFVGVYPANTLVQMAGQHLMVQLYREYVNRGGEPLPEPGARARPHEGDREDPPDGRW